MKCPNCGGEVADLSGEYYCPKCGVEISDDGQIIPDRENQSSLEQKINETGFMSEVGKENKQDQKASFEDQQEGLAQNSPATSDNNSDGSQEDTSNDNSISQDSLSNDDSAPGSNSDQPTQSYVAPSLEEEEKSGTSLKKQEEQQPEGLEEEQKIEGGSLQEQGEETFLQSQKETKETPEIEDKKGDQQDGTEKIVSQEQENAQPVIRGAEELNDSVKTDEASETGTSPEIPDLSLPSIVEGTQEQPQSPDSDQNLSEDVSSEESPLEIKPDFSKPSPSVQDNTFEEEQTSDQNETEPEKVSLEENQSEGKQTSEYQANVERLRRELEGETSEKSESSVKNESQLSEESPGDSSSEGISAFKKNYVQVSENGSVADPVITEESQKNILESDEKSQEEDNVSRSFGSKPEDTEDNSEVTSRQNPIDSVLSSNENKLDLSSPSSQDKMADNDNSPEDTTNNSSNSPQDNPPEDLPPDSPSSPSVNNVLDLSSKDSKKENGESQGNLPPDSSSGSVLQKQIENQNQNSASIVALHPASEWYKNWWGILILIFCVGPLGGIALWFIWSKINWSKEVKWVISVVIVIFTIYLSFLLGSVGK